MNLLLVDDEIAMLHIMEKAIDLKKKGIHFCSLLSTVFLFSAVKCEFHYIPADL